MPEAAVIIPHYNDTARLQCGLAALMPTLPPDMEVVVVGNGFADPLDAVSSACPDPRIVTELRKDAAMARNRGVQGTTAARLFFLNCDCVPAPD